MPPSNTLDHLRRKMRNFVATPMEVDVLPQRVETSLGPFYATPEPLPALRPVPPPGGWPDDAGWPEAATEHFATAGEEPQA